TVKSGRSDGAGIHRSPPVRDRRHFDTGHLPPGLPVIRIMHVARAPHPVFRRTPARKRQGRRRTRGRTGPAVPSGSNARRSTHPPHGCPGRRRSDYARRVPLGTGRSTAARTTPSAGGKPVSRNSERNGPICLGEKLMTPTTWRPSSDSGVYRAVICALVFFTP